MGKTHVVITVGTGGVGKTTIACILGLHYAKQKLKTLVITVDPARRLLDAFGIKESDKIPKKVSLERFFKEPVRGELYAFMPDLKAEWSDFLTASIKKEELRHEISSNHFYRYMADGLPGSLEIICSHILFRLLKSGEYDCIILDTPPASHSLNFFDVPQKITRVLDQNIFHKLIKRKNSFLYSFTKNIASFSGNILEHTLERLIGSHFLSELLDFALGIDGLYEPLLERTRAMDTLLKDNATKYVVVTRPSLVSVKDSIKLLAALKKRALKVDKLVLNQITPILNEDTHEIKNYINHLVDTEKRVKLEQLYGIFEAQLSFEKDLMREIYDKFKDISFHQIYKSNQKERELLLIELLDNFERIK